MSIDSIDCVQSYKLYKPAALYIKENRPRLYERLRSEATDTNTKLLERLNKNMLRFLDENNTNYSEPEDVEKFSIQVWRHIRIGDAMAKGIYEALKIFTQTVSSIS